ncbi:nuclear transport factor 2 family protein [Massilia sp. G4R7]|uniref:Nuclear transport factor 2 family protein n=1 Tax=Massilia phyllostachyos TaxID=2898585 RepID=A0ABS8Q479_9BURK|nr:nuclear transport factor 2 family protein [Massilia phyllostachyos]MCD2516548.1 nuclear transport factor 2 family protein [Massilia phyllostachyos]
MRLRSLSLLAACLMLAATANVPTSARDSNQDLRRQVMDAERAFAATMKARDFDAFIRYVADEAIFLSPQGKLRGKQAIARGWRPYYDKPQAPFSWEPEEVEVVASGTLAYSGGPIYDPSGRRIGRFNSIWRLEAPGQWKVVFDRGSDFAPPPARK